MNVFISWSGERSRLLASALAELLPDVIQDLTAWMSEHDISAGSRWSHELNQQLEDSNCGIICLTPENLSAPWLLFESGSLSKSVSDSKVIPYRLELTSTDIPFPLAQFQGVDADEAGTLRLLESLNSARESPMDADRLNRVFQRWWPDLRCRIESIPKNEDTTSQPQRSDRALLEEVLELVRTPRMERKSSEEDPEAYSEHKVPKTAVWRTVHDIKEPELKRMTIDELREYIEKLDKRDRVTPHGGEESALWEAEKRAKGELARREEKENEVDQ